MPTTVGHDEALDRLQRMDNYGFEHFVADLWARQGWNTEVSQASIDAGVDVVATKETPYPQKMLIQAKRYGPNTTVGGPDIQQYASLKHQEQGVDSVVVVTSNGFSSHALDRAEELNVKTVDGNGLVNMLGQLNSHDLLEKYGTAAPSSGRTRSDSSTVDNRSSSGEGVIDSIREIAQDASPDTHYRVIQIGTIVWALGFLLGVIGYSGNGGTLDSIFGLLAMALWFAIPISIYYEAQRVEMETDWSPFYRAYAVAAAIPFLNVLSAALYLLRRRQAYANAKPDTVEFDNLEGEEPAMESENADQVTERAK